MSTEDDTRVGHREVQHRGFGRRSPAVRLPTLQHGYRLGIPAGDMLEIFAPGDQLCLSIRLDPAGPLVELRAQSLRVAASGDVSVDCDTFNVHARRDISLVSAGDIAQDAGGDIVLRADGELATAAAGQHHHARLGSINLRANWHSPSGPARRRRRRRQRWRGGVSCCSGAGTTVSGMMRARR